MAVDRFMQIDHHHDSGFDRDPEQAIYPIHAATLKLNPIQY